MLVWKRQKVDRKCACYTIQVPARDFLFPQVIKFSPLNMTTRSHLANSQRDLSTNVNQTVPLSCSQLAWEWNPDSFARPKTTFPSWLLPFFSSHTTSRHSLGTKPTGIHEVLLLHTSIPSGPVWWLLLLLIRHSMFSRPDYLSPVGHSSSTISWKRPCPSSHSPTRCFLAPFDHCLLSIPLQCHFHKGGIPCLLFSPRSQVSSVMPAPLKLLS